MSDFETDPDDAGSEHFDDSEALLPALGVIEDQPLPDRAAAYSQLYDQLQGRLEGGTPARG